MKLAGLLGCGSILHAACREDEETAKPSKLLALEVPLEGGGWRDRHGRAVPLNQLWITPHALCSQEEGSHGRHSLPQTAAPQEPRTWWDQPAGSRIRQGRDQPTPEDLDTWPLSQVRGWERGQGLSTPGTQQTQVPWGARSSGCPGEAASWSR